MIAETLKRNRKTLLVQFAIGLAVGAIGATVVLDHGSELGLERAHERGLLLALLLAALGLFIVISSLTRAGAAQMIGAQVEPGEDIAPELNAMRWQGLVTLLAGAELLVLALDPAFLAGPARTWLLPLLMIILVAQTWLNVVLWRRGDEFFRRVIAEAAVISFIAFQFLLFFWTAGVRFAFLPDPETLDIYVLMMAIYLLGSGIAGVRHGYGMPG